MGELCGRCGASIDDGNFPYGAEEARGEIVELDLLGVDEPDAGTSRVNYDCCVGGDGSLLKSKWYCEVGGVVVGGGAPHD